MKPKFKLLIVSMLMTLLICKSSLLLADLANAPENPYPANGATGIQLQDLRLSWSQTQDAPNQPYQYQGLYIYASPKTIPGYTYKFTDTGIHYYLSNSADTWTNAKAICYTNKWRMGCPWHANIQTNMKNNNEGVTTWIGFSDSATEAAFRWENGRDFSYTNWALGEPNGGATENCVEMWSNGTWNDAQATSSRRYWIEVDSFISHTKVIGTNYYDLNCKLEPNTTYNWALYTKNLSGYGPTSNWSFTTGSDGTAPSSYPATASPDSDVAETPLNPTLTWAAVPGATYYKLYVYRSRGDRIGLQHAYINGHVYQKTTTELNYADSKAAVEADGGHLVAINDAEEQAILPNDYNYWIGFHDPTGDGYSGEGWFSWNVGEPSAFYNWDLNYGPPEPNGQTAENYVIQGTSGMWYDLPATNSYRSLYEYPADVLDGVVVYGTSYSFRETNLAANTLYRWIAVPYNEYGRPFFSSGQRSFKTIASGGSAPGVVSSAGITPIDTATGVPINTNLTWQGATGSPTEYYAYMGTNNSIGNSGNYTDLGFYNGHHYYRSNHGYTWHWAAANVQAQKDGGYLATFGTAAEDAIFNSTDKLWYGATDMKAANIFKYANGDPWYYTNWFGTEPNNFEGSQYFIAKNHSDTNQWDDDAVSALYKYAVEVAPNIADGTRVLPAKAITITYTPSLLRFNTTYYWSVVASNDYGMANDTQRWSFTTTDGKPVNPDPANTAGDVANNVFDWDDVAGATGYLFYLGTADGVWDLVNAAPCEAKGSTYTYMGPSDPFTDYYWKVDTVTPLETIEGNVWTFGTGEHTLPVELSSFTAIITSDLTVKIAWVAQSETNHSGYNVLRSEANALDCAITINPILIDQGENLGTQISYAYTDVETYSNMVYYYWLESVSLDGVSDFYGPLTVTIGDPTLDPLPPVTPMVTQLLHAFPNPFNPNTNIRYSLKEAGKVNIDIYNVKGQIVRSFDANYNSPGYYQVSWDGKDMNGRTASSGIYMYRMVCGSYSSSKKMILAK
jgi:hypothetical protein